MSESSSYGERPPLQGGFRRSFTIPARSLSFHEKAGLDKTDADADILYTNPTARIFSFSPPTDSIKSTSKAEIPPDTDYPIDAVETLPWRSRGETLSANGNMIIEKVRGSTHFLKCQTVTHAILRNSQCWCVDGESKFVLRVRKFQYYRIELPSSTEEDKAKVEELKKVFATVMRYERTPCPFIRAFTVDLPDDAITPRRKGAWKRRDSSLSNTPDTTTPSLRRTKNEKSWSPRTPPTSYPKGAPGSVADNERGRSGGPAGLYRRSSLFEDYRNSSPSNQTMSDDGTDSEPHGSEHDSESVSEPDRSHTESPRKQLNITKTREQSVSRIIKDREAAIQSSRINTSQSAYRALGSDRRMTNSAMGEDPVAEPGVGLVEQIEQLAAQQEATSHEPTTTELSSIVSAESKKPAAQAYAPQHEDRPPPITELPQDTTASTTGIIDSASESLPSSLDETESKASPPTTTLPTAHATSSSEEGTINSETEGPELAEKVLGLTIAPASAQSAELIVDLDRTSSPLTESDRESTSNSVSVSESESESELESEPESESASESRSEPVSNSDSVLEQQPRLYRQQERPDLSLYEEGQDYEASADGTDSEIEEKSIDNGARPQVEAEMATTVKQKVLPDVPRSQMSTLADVATEEDQQLQQINIGSELTSVETSDMNDYGNSINYDEMSPVSSVDSFHTLASVSGSALSIDQPSFAEETSIEQRGRLSQAKFGHKRELSEMTVTASSMSDPASPEHTMAPRQENEIVNTVPLHSSSISNSSRPEPSSSSTKDDSEGLRQRVSGPRSFSPMPPASTIFTGNQIRHDSGRGHMTKAILQKVVVKPIEFAVLVVHILARIAGGATVNDLLSGDLFKRPEHGRNISGFADQLTKGRGSSDTEDDYGVPIRGRKRSMNQKRISTIFDAGDESGLEDVD